MNTTLREVLYMVKLQLLQPGSEKTSATEPEALWTKRVLETIAFAGATAQHEKHACLAHILTRHVPSHDCLENQVSGQSAALHYGRGDPASLATPHANL